jgi:hypothetical protein
VDLAMVVGFVATAAVVEESTPVLLAAAGAVGGVGLEDEDTDLVVTMAALVDEAAFLSAAAALAAASTGADIVASGEALVLASALGWPPSLESGTGPHATWP